MKNNKNLLTPCRATIITRNHLRLNYGQTVTIVETHLKNFLGPSSRVMPDGDTSIYHVFDYEIWPSHKQFSFEELETHRQLYANKLKNYEED